MKEIWKQLIYIYNDGRKVEFKNKFEISSIGRFKYKNYMRTGKDYIVDNFTNRRYYHLNLYFEGNYYYLNIHRMVMSTFVPESDTYESINHKDENTHNNFVWVNEDGSIDLDKSNLEWCSNKYNSNYGTRIERQSSCLKGRKRTKEQVEKWRKKMVGRKLSKETKEKMKIASSKPVVQLTKDFVEIATFQSGKVAEQLTGIKAPSIAAVCKGKRNTAGGYVWKYKEGA